MNFILVDKFDEKFELNDVILRINMESKINIADMIFDDLIFRYLMDLYFAKKHRANSV